jgi:transcriptional regulator
MFIPPKFLAKDHSMIVSFMCQYNFATIVTIKNGIPNANHLPFTVREENDRLLLSAHFSKGNDQWKEITNAEVLVIFSEPHAYISPKHYDAKLSVPTWDYIAVHAYGKATIVEDNNLVFKELERMIDNHDPEYRKQWDVLPDDYKQNMRKAIVAFDVEVTSIQAKNKQSQHKSEVERQRIMHSLENSAQGTERDMGAWMRKEHEKKKL